MKNCIKIMFILTMISEGLTKAAVHETAQGPHEIAQSGEAARFTKNIQQQMEERKKQDFQQRYLQNLQYARTFQEDNKGLSNWTKVKAWFSGIGTKGDLAKVKDAFERISNRSLNNYDFILTDEEKEAFKNLDRQTQLEFINEWQKNLTNEANEQLNFLQNENRKMTEEFNKQLQGTFFFKTGLNEEISQLQSEVDRSTNYSEKEKLLQKLNTKNNEKITLTKKFNNFLQNNLLQQKTLITNYNEKHKNLSSAIESLLPNTVVLYFNSHTDKFEFHDLVRLFHGPSHFTDEQHEFLNKTQQNRELIRKLTPEEITLRKEAYQKTLGYPQQMTSISQQTVSAESARPQITPTTSKLESKSELLPMTSSTQELLEHIETQPSTVPKQIPTISRIKFEQALPIERTEGLQTHEALAKIERKLAEQSSTTSKPTTQVPLSTTQTEPTTQELSQQQTKQVTPKEELTTDELLAKFGG